MKDVTNRRYWNSKRYVVIKNNIKIDVRLVLSTRLLNKMHITYPNIIASVLVLVSVAATMDIMRL